MSALMLCFSFLDLYEAGLKTLRSADKDWFEELMLLVQRVRLYKGNSGNLTWIRQGVAREGVGFLSEDGCMDENLPSHRFYANLFGYNCTAVSGSASTSTMEVHRLNRLDCVTTNYCHIKNPGLISVSQLEDAKLATPLLHAYNYVSITGSEERSEVLVKILEQGPLLRKQGYYPVFYKIKPVFTKHFNDDSLIYIKSKGYVLSGTSAYDRFSSLFLKQ